MPSLNEQAEVVHSLAKWKRYALYKYGFRPGQGIVTDMNAVRRDEELDNLHSIYVDQWDWSALSLPTSARWNFCRRPCGTSWTLSAQRLTSCAGSSPS